MATIYRELTQGPAAETAAVAGMASVLGHEGGFAELNTSGSRSSAAPKPG